MKLQFAEGESGLRFCTIIVVLAAAWVAYAPSGPKWRKLGPGGGGALFYPTISPHDAGTVLVGCDMTGSYISRDAGESWPGSDPARAQ